jgi:hypothetical protein
MFVVLMKKLLFSFPKGLVQGRTLVGGPGGQSPPEALGILGIAYIYLNNNFEPTTPFLSDQKNLMPRIGFY